MNSYLLSCNCKCCEGFLFQKFDNSVVCSAVSSDFYSKQSFLNNFKEYKKNLLETKILKDISIDKKQLLELQSFLEDAYLEIEDPKKYESYDYEGNVSLINFEDLFTNDSHLRFKFNNSEDNFDVYLISDLTLQDKILFKIYKAYDIIYTKKDITRLLNEINIVLKKNEEFIILNELKK